MDAESELALSVAWWVVWRDKPRVRSALIKAHLEHWVPAVRDVLDQNKRSGRTPGTWTALADALHRDWVSLWRSRTGHHGLTQPDFLALATILNIPTQSLFPTATQWIAMATCYLCPALRLNEAQAYAMYRLQNPSTHNPHLDAAVVRDVSRVCYEREIFGSSAAVEKAIVNVAKGLGCVLKAIGGDSIPGARRE